jgi:CBS domain-containing protein
MHELHLVTDFLHAVPPFSALPPAELEAVARRFEAAYYRQGRTVLQSEPPAGIAVIRKGAVRLVDGRGRFLEKRSEGELFGQPAWFRGERRAYRAEAEEDSLVWHLAQSDFDALCEQNPLVADWFSEHLKTRLSAAAQVSGSATQLRDLLRRPPVMIGAARSIREAAALMSQESVSSLLVMRGDTLAGIVTDSDLRSRVLAAGIDAERPVSEAMTPDPQSLPPAADLDSAVLAMMRRNCHHLPVVDEGRPLGMLTAGDLLRAQSEHPLRLVSDIYRRRSVDDLAALSLRLPALFVRTVSLGRDVEQIGRLVTHIADAFTIRLLQLGEAQLGPPPQRYAWLAFGSQAREEQTATTDQDNGLLLEHDADASQAAYFERLADFVCRGLDRLGYAYCPGEIMALNPQWRVSLERWKRHFDQWIDEPEPTAVMHSSIFFDLRCVHGSRALADDLLAHAAARARDNGIFLRFMAGNVLTHRPPIGFFRQFVQEDDGTHSEGLNLKHRGSVPVTDLVRIRALEQGLAEPNSYRRLECLTAAGSISPADAASLRDALILINRVRLRNQAEQLAAGAAPGNFVAVESLSPLLRRNLKAAFMLVAEAQKALAVRYQLL